MKQINKLPVILTLILLCLVALGIFVLGLPASVDEGKLIKNNKNEIFTELNENPDSEKSMGIKEKAQEAGLPLEIFIDQEITKISKETIANRVLWVNIFAIFITVFGLFSFVLSLIMKRFTPAMLSVALVGLFFAVMFALEPTRFPLYFIIDFWYLIVSLIIGITAMLANIVIMSIIDEPFRKRLVTLILISVISLALGTLLFFLLGDFSDMLLQGEERLTNNNAILIDKYHVSNVWYTFISLACYSTYVLVGAGFTFFFASLITSLVSNKK